VHSEMGIQPLDNFMLRLRRCFSLAHMGFSGAAQPACTGAARYGSVPTFGAKVPSCCAQNRLLAGLNTEVTAHATRDD
jgi:hypothetical protein